MTDEMKRKIETAAWAGEAMPDGLKPVEQIYFHGCSFIFHNFRGGVIGKDAVRTYQAALLQEIQAMEVTA